MFPAAAIPSNRMMYASQGTWLDMTVTVTADGPCPVPGHELERWVRADGQDTGHLYCRHCDGLADCPWAFDCGEPGEGGWCNLTPGHDGPHCFRGLAG